VRIVATITASQLAGLGFVGALAVGVGLLRRRHPWWGAVLAGSAVLGTILLAVLGTYRPLIFMAGASLFVIAISADARGHRGIGIVGLAVGLPALVLAFARF
jgi:hypothetical protein